MTSTRRIKIGIAGCGSISQIMHLPHLFEMREEFELVADRATRRGLVASHRRP
jgi:predicted dehydrogenase